MSQSILPDNFAAQRREQVLLYGSHRRVRTCHIEINSLASSPRADDGNIKLACSPGLEPGYRSKADYDALTVRSLAIRVGANVNFRTIKLPCPLARATQATVASPLFRRALFGGIRTPRPVVRSTSTESVFQRGLYEERSLVSLRQKFWALLSSATFISRTAKPSDVLPP